MLTYPDDADGNALARLAAHGADMSQPRLLQFAVYAPNKCSAQIIKEALIHHGYQAHAYCDEGEPINDGAMDPDDEEFGPSWTVQADIIIVPTYEQVIRIQVELDRFAVPLGGRADGWGTMMESGRGSP